MNKDARRHGRVPYVGPVRLTWEDSRGESRFAQAKCIDVSSGGLRIESPAPVPLGARIHLNADRIKLAGPATVKHVNRYGARFILGCEMAQVTGERTLAALREPWALRSPAGIV